MEEFKSLDQLTKIDRKYLSNEGSNETTPSLEKLHQLLTNEVLNDAAPYQTQDQFNIIKNMALYSYFCRSLTAEVQLKTYSLIEYALNVKIRPKKPMMLKALMNHALENHWITDSGFRHIKSFSPDNQGCQSLIEQIPSLINLHQLGSNILMGSSLEHIAICTDFINQLFPDTNNSISNQSSCFSEKET